MRVFSVLFLSLAISSFSFAQKDTVNKTKHYSLSFSFGITQLSANSVVNNSTVTVINNPILSEPFRYLRIGMRRQLKNNVSLGMDLGYQRAVAGLGLQAFGPVFLSEVKMVMNQSLFIQPQLFYSFKVDKMLYIEPKLGAVISLQLADNDQQSLSGRDVEVQLNHKAERPLYATLNGGIALRCIPMPEFYISFFADYIYGLKDVLTVNGTSTNDGVTESFSASYTGTGWLLGIKLEKSVF